MRAGLGYIPLTEEALQKAALFWAEARQSGRPGASDDPLDGDVVLAAQAATLNVDADVIVVNDNQRHLKRFVRTCRLQDYS